MSESSFTRRKRKLYPDGPLISPVGFGSYRIGLGHPEHALALEKALLQGVNLIDTSSTYAHGESEILIGQVTSHLFDQRKLSCDQLVFVTKCGFLSDQDADDFDDIYSFPGGLRYCLHPEFIRTQVDQSLKRLQIDCIDVYLLHNPEYVLKFFELNGSNKEQAQAAFYQQIQKSFECLEGLVSTGKIKAYGISSNTFGAPDDDFSFVSLKKAHDIAQKISSSNHFKVVQMPLNWLEISPAFYELENTQESTISYAKKHGIGVLTNGPFNAMLNDNLIRLTRPQIHDQDILKLDPQALAGFENWKALSQDLELLAKKQLEQTPGYEDATLSQLALATLVWIPGISCVLCGMRQERYVTDAQNALSRPTLLSAKNVLYNIYENLEFHT